MRRRISTRRDRRRDVAPAATDAPCAPCGQQAGARMFALVDDAVAEDVADDLLLRPAAGARFAVVDGEVVLFDPIRATSTLLNPSAALIWASIDGRTCVGELIDDLVADTGGDRTVIDRDVRAAIARLRADGIVEDGRDDGPPEAAPDAAAVGASTSDEREQRRRRRLDGVLDRMAWHGVGQVRWCGGARVVVRAGSAELAAALAPALVALPAADAEADAAPDHVVWVLDRGRGPRRYRIVSRSETRGWAATVPDATDLVLAELDDLAALHAGGRVVLHAGAVERDGVVVVLVGPSGAGKSTLTAHLVQHGFGYVTDEVVAVEPGSWSTTPYPRVIGLRDDAVDLVGLEAHRTGDPGKVRVDPAALGRVSTGGTVGLVVLLGRPTGDAADRPTTRGAALVELLASTYPSTFETGTGPDEPLDVLAELVRAVPVVHLPRQPLDDAHRTIAAHLPT